MFLYISMCRLFPVGDGHIVSFNCKTALYTDAESKPPRGSETLLETHCLSSISSRAIRCVASPVGGKWLRCYTGFILKKRLLHGRSRHIMTQQRLWVPNSLCLLQLLHWPKCFFLVLRGWWCSSFPPNTAIMWKPHKLLNKHAHHRGQGTESFFFSVKMISCVRSILSLRFHCEHISWAQRPKPCFSSVHCPLIR